PCTCGRTATQVSGEGLPAPALKAGRGCLPARAAYGPSRGPSCSAWAGLEAQPTRASRLRSPPTETPPSWADGATTSTLARRGYSPAAAEDGPSKGASWAATP